MYLIQRITTNPYQKQTLVLDNGVSLTLTLLYRPMQYGWFIERLTYQDFELNCVRITNNLNMLHQWRNLLPFGLGCISQSQREPTQQEDFSSSASKLYILTADEVEEYAAYLRNG